MLQLSLVLGSGHRAGGRGACALSREGQPNLHGCQNVSGGVLSYFSVVLDFFPANANSSFSRRKPLGCSIVGTEVGVQRPPSCCVNGQHEESCGMG